MANNISNCQYISGKLYMKRADAIKLTLKYKGSLYVSNFLDELDLEGNLHEQLGVDPYFDGEGSGRNFHVFLEILQSTSGNADILLIWEDGDSFSGLRVRDGSVEEKEVYFSLDAPEGEIK